MAERDFDVLVIGGGGSGGFTAATTAMKSGARVVMVEASRLGGLCILAGCMPSKTLLHSAEKLMSGPRPGRESYPDLLSRKRRVVEELAGRRVKAVDAKEAAGLEVIGGRAKLVDAHTVEADGRRITAQSLVVATGSTEVIPSLPGLEQAGYLVSESLMEAAALPESMIVLGGGAIALEMAQYLARMGVETTLIQRSEVVLSSEDQRVGRLLQEALAAEGVTMYTGTELTGVEATDGGKRVSFRHGGDQAGAQAAEILVCLGRRPNSDGLGLEAAGVELGRGGAVQVDGRMRTNVENIFAAGDVTGVNMVVNLAIVQGEVAGHNAAGGPPRDIGEPVVPQAVFTDPEFAKVGLNARQCRERGIDFVEAEYQLEDMGVALTYPQPPRGFMLMRAEPASGRILGAEMVAPHASLMIHDTAMTMKLGGAPSDMADLPYVHPCLAELTNLCAYRLARLLSR